MSGLDGKVFAEPFDAFQLFKMSVIADPTGGMVFICQLKEHIGAGVKSEHGALAWSELLTPDPKTAAGFFADLLDVNLESRSMGDVDEYMVITVGTESVGGIMEMPKHLVEQKVPPHWEPFFQVDNVDDAVGIIEGAGSKILSAPNTIEGVGRFMVAQDPQGAAFGLITPWL